MKKVLIAVFVFIVLSVSIAVLTLRHFEREIRLEIQTGLSNKTGRPVVIEGEVKIHYSLNYRNLLIELTTCYIKKNLILFILKNEEMNYTIVSLKGD